MTVDTNIDKEKSEEIDINGLVSVDEKRVKEIFDDNYQNKFINIFMNNVEFYEQIFDIVVPEYFSTYQREIVDKIIKYVVTNNGRPDYGDLSRQIRIDTRSEQHKEFLLGTLSKIKDTKVGPEAPIIETAYLYFKKKRLANALYECVQKWNENDFDGIVSPINDAMKAGEAKDSGLNYFDTIDQTLTDDVRQPVSTMPAIDALTSGGLSAGELGIIMAPTGGGKSMALVILACHAYLNGSNVVYYSLELSEKYVARRFHANLNDIHQAFLKYFPEVIKERANEVQSRGGNLIIKKFTTRSATVQTLKNHLSSIERDHNFKPDIVFIDYADIMKPEQVFKEHRHTLQVLYQTIRGLGDEMGFPIWSATQTNREGSKGENVGIDTISDAYGKAAEVDLLISIGKNEESKDIKFDPDHVFSVTEPNSRVGFLKNRLGPDGFFLDSILDTSRVYWEILDKKKSSKDKGGESNSKRDFSKEAKARKASTEREKVSDDFEMRMLENSSEGDINNLLLGTT